MSPEQARGENESLDGRADIYALGIILYVMLLRKHPHNINPQDRAATLREIALGEVRPPRELRPGFSGALEQIMLKALARNREDRYATANEFGAAIRRFLKDRIKEKREGTGKSE